MKPDKYINQAETIMAINYHKYGSDGLYIKAIEAISKQLRLTDNLMREAHDKDILIKTLSGELANRKSTIKELEKHIKWLKKEHKKFIGQYIKELDKIKRCLK